jgi:DNA-binding LacI/PurR family transcriptional regulator
MSIQEIAQLAGVPYSTTWRVINRSPGVSAEATDAVRRAMEQTGYTPAIERRRVVRSGLRPRHRNIAFLYLRDSNALSVSIVRAVQRISHEERLNLVFGHVTGPADLPPALQTSEVEGVLGYGEFPASAMTPELTQIPAVWMMSPCRDISDTWGDRVMPDHRAIGFLAADYLLERGHRHLAFFDAAGDSPFFAMRAEAFTTRAHGRAKSVQIIRADADLPYGDLQVVMQIVERWAKLSPRPTGLFVPKDAITVSVYGLLQQRGVRPGHDVDIVSCNNQKENLSLIHPSPASIDLNRETVARLAVERLLWRIREGTNSPPVRIVVSPTLDGHRA